jgi:hypothetical protein
MNIIRDDEMYGLMMIPLLHKFGVTRCNVSKCCEKPTTIITGITDKPIGLCEKHYNECKEKGKIDYTLYWCAVEDEN